MNTFSNLFKPLVIKGISIRNRIVMPAMNTNFAEEDGYVSERFTRYYVERGKGGVGLVITSPVYVDPTARKRGRSLLLYDDCFIPKLKEFTRAMHETGAKILLQLNHNGRLITSSKALKTSAEKGSAVGPSPIQHLVTGEIPHVLSLQEIRALIDKFGQTAQRAKQAGFDGVELNGAHGYLINQFFSIYSNTRSDRYGGNLENRMRFPLDVYRRVRQLTGYDFLVAYRLSAREFAPIETPFQDVIEFCQRLEGQGIDILHVSAGNCETPSMLLKIAPFGSASPGCYADFAAAVKAKVRIPVIAVGRINTPEIAEQILSQGKADFVATGRALIADAHWPKKAFQGEVNKIRRCIGCHQGCSERLAQENEITCLYNPEVGNEVKPSLVSRRKTVWVIGGGPAGMEAASIAASRGHAVTLYERTAKLGGQCILAEKPPGKEDFSAVRIFLEKELGRQPITVHLNHEITIESLAQGRPDVVIVATGSVPLIPKLPGIKGENVVTAWDVLRGERVGQKVLVAGAGLVGIETALFLSEKGKKVILIEKLESIAADAGPLNKVRLEEWLRGTDIVTKCKTELLGVTKKGATVKCENRKYEIPTETVVLALGARALNDLYEQLEGKVSELYRIGDCVAPRKMLDAIHEAYDLGLKI